MASYVTKAERLRYILRNLMYNLINFLYLAKNYLNIFVFTSSKFAISLLKRIRGTS